MGSENDIIKSKLSRKDAHENHTHFRRWAIRSVAERKRPMHS